MSSAKGSGGGRTRAQAYQNKTTFRHNKGSKKTQKIAATANSGGLCPRCADKIEWRIKYRKYKPLTVPRVCNGCGERAVKAAYRTLCAACAKARGACPQCAVVRRDLTPAVQTKAEEAREYEMLEGFVEALRERDRRTVHRKVERGEDVLAPLYRGSEGTSESESDGSESDGSDSEDSEGAGSACAGSDCADSESAGSESAAVPAVLARDMSAALKL